MYQAYAQQKQIRDSMELIRKLRISREKTKLFPNNVTNQILGKALQYEAVDEFKYVGIPIKFQQLSTKKSDEIPTIRIHTKQILSMKMKIYVLNTFILSKIRYKWLQFMLISSNKDRDLRKFNTKLKITIKTALEIPMNTPLEISEKVIEP